MMTGILKKSITKKEVVIIFDVKYNLDPVHWGFN